MSRLMPGMTWKTLKHHPSLVPLWVSIVGGAALAGGYLTRLATQNPDTSFDRKNNPHPWQKYSPTDQYKFYAVKINYKELENPKERPEI